MVPANGYRPLKGKRIVITRPLEQSDKFADLLSSLGAEPVKFPVIAIAPPDNWEAADRAIEDLKEYGWVVLTSVNGVQAFIGRLVNLGKDIREAFHGVRICTVGMKTADAVEQYGLRVDFVPEEFRAEAIAEGFKKIGAEGERILIPRAQTGREILPEELTRIGMNVDVAPTYKIVRPDVETAWLREMLRKKEIDVVTFTSGSCVRNFIEILGVEEYKVLLAGVKIACISPVTADSVIRYGLNVDIVPERYTVEDLAEAIARHYIEDIRHQTSDIRPFSF